MKILLTLVPVALCLNGCCTQHAGTGSVSLHDAQEFHFFVNEFCSTHFPGYYRCYMYGFPQWGGAWPGRSGGHMPPLVPEEAAGWMIATSDGPLSVLYIELVPRLRERPDGYLFTWKDYHVVSPELARQRCDFTDKSNPERSTRVLSQALKALGKTEQPAAQ